LSVWDLGRFDLREAANLQKFAEMTAGRMLFGGDKGEEGKPGKRDFIQITPLTPDRVYKHWLEVGKGAGSRP
jgi:hypothetical protein